MSHAIPFLPVKAASWENAFEQAVDSNIQSLKDKFSVGKTQTLQLFSG